jgi:hypothetical protein
LLNEDGVKDVALESSVTRDVVVVEAELNADPSLTELVIAAGDVGVT